MEKRGLLIVVSGFSGAGKGTLMNQLVQSYDGYALSVSATTRQPRPDETDGKHYFFLTEQAFEDLIEKGELLEHAKYINHYYGTPKKYVLSQLDKGKDVLLEIEIQGALQVKKAYPQAILIFVIPPSFHELLKRLKGRGTESQKEIDLRLKRVREEAIGIEKYDYILVNDKLNDCADELNNLVRQLHILTDKAECIDVDALKDCILRKYTFEQHKNNIDEIRTSLNNCIEGD